MENLRNKKLAILGIGGYFSEKRKYLDPALDIVCYADNDSSKWGTCPYEDGVKCIAPVEMKDREIEMVVIGIRRGKNYGQLKTQAEQLGFMTCSLNVLINQYIDVYEAKQREMSEQVVSSLFKDSAEGHRLILLNTPQVTSTIGDHAIATAEVLFLEKYFADYQRIEIGDRFFWDNRDEIKRRIYPSDVLLIQGGGYLGSLWRMWREDTVRYILQTYTKNHIIILPQTMFFEDSEDGKLQRSISGSIYNSHGSLTMCFREENSYKLSKEILDSRMPRYLIPDTVIGMEYTGPIRSKKSIAFCMKNDKETICSREYQNKIVSELRAQGYDVVTTTMFHDEKIYSAQEREQIVRRKMDELAGYRLVITDAMHCMVLAAVCGTACIGVESITGKVGGIYQWLKAMPYVRYTANISEIIGMVGEMEIYMDQHNSYEHSQFNGYFQQLADIISDAAAI